MIFRDFAHQKLQDPSSSAMDTAEGTSTFQQVEKSANGISWGLGGVHPPQFYSGNSKGDSKISRHFEQIH